MKKKSYYAAALALAMIAGTAATASARGTVTIHGATPEADRTFDLTTELKIGFGSDKSAITVAQGNADVATFPLSQVSSISFNGNFGGVDDISQDLTNVINLRNNPVENLLQFTTAPAEPCRATVYSLQGSALVSIARWQGEDIDVSNLNTGIYLLQFNNQTIKFYKK